MKNYSNDFMRLRLVFVFVVGLLLSGCQMELYSNLSENDVNNMLSIMLSNNITSEKIKDKKS
ncbi:MAG: hypothetical protein KAH03_08460, partial [Cocleimonas sp.]|nr:hypothetical protein [Cocleimonas sp.]